jgi:hypothetical protein
METRVIQDRFAALAQARKNEQKRRQQEVRDLLYALRLRIAADPSGPTLYEGALLLQHEEVR